jgi:hypothetical protein
MKVSKGLFALKRWLTLEDTAARLSASADEPVTVRDILQLALEGHLNISWYLRNRPARRVAPVSLLFGRGFGAELSADINPDRAFVSPKDSETLAVLMAHIACGVDDSGRVYPTTGLHEGENIRILSGPHTILLKSSAAAMDWFDYLCLDAPSLVQLRGPIFVTSDDRDMLQVMDMDVPPGLEISPADLWMDVWPAEPTTNMPRKSELVVERFEIENLEASIASTDILESAQLDPRRETSMLNAIGALVEIATKGLTTGTLPAGSVGPASNIKSQSDLIQAISDQYAGYPGLSKRNLQKLFAEARRKVSEPQ